MIDFLERLFAEPVWWSYLFRVLFFYLLAWIVHRLSERWARRLLRLNRFRSQRAKLRPERFATLRGLLASAISFVAFALATLAVLAIIVGDIDTIFWMIGLFSAAFGLGARPVISDFLTGISFIFEDTFDVGEKVHLPGLAGGEIEGVVESVDLRTTLVRASSGELLTIPNGEIRVIRNFSRGRFSTADVKVKVAAEDLSQAIPLLELLGKEAVTLLPNLLEPWQVISATGEISQQTELILTAKARYGMAAEMRPRLLTLVQERLAEAGITLAG